MRRTLRYLVFALVSVGLVVGPGSMGADWPRFRGPNVDGASPEEGLFRRSDAFELTRWVGGTEMTGELERNRAAHAAPAQ